MAEDRKKTDMLEKLAEGWNFDDENANETDSLKERIRQRVIAERQREIGVKAMRRRLLFESGEGEIPPEPQDDTPKDNFTAIRDDREVLEDSEPEAEDIGDTQKPRDVKSVYSSQNRIFKIYAAKDPSAAFFETDRGDAFDGCFRDPSEEPAGAYSVTQEDTLNELLSGIGDRSFAVYDDGEDDYVGGSLAMSSDEADEPADSEETEAFEEPAEDEPLPDEPQVIAFPVAEEEHEEFEKISFFDFAEAEKTDDAKDFDETSKRIRAAINGIEAEPEEPFDEPEEPEDEPSAEDEKPSPDEFEFEIEELEDVSGSEETETAEEPEEEFEAEPEDPVEESAEEPIEEDLPAEEEASEEEPEETEEPEEETEAEETEDEEPEPEFEAQEQSAPAGISEQKTGNAARRALFDLDIGSIYMNEIAAGSGDEKKMSSRDMHALTELVRHDDDEDRFTATGNTKECNEAARKLKQALDELGVEAAVQKVCAGPSVITVTVRAENAPAIIRDSEFAANIGSKIGADVRVNIVALSGSMSFEISREKPQKLYVYEVLKSQEFIGGKAAIPVPLGLDTAGNAIVTDIKAVSHLLAAGEQNTGKSTVLKAIVIGVMCGTLPRDVKLMLLDPKGGFSDVFGKIPHLIMPVERDPQKCVEALKWAVSEMSGRLDVLRKEGFDDIDEFNASKRGRGSVKKMPRIVIVVDEFAELMALPKANVERLILPLVQIGGAAGIHVVLFTGKLSVEAITGLIKANVGTRIAFKVATRVQSRIIIDAAGAEKLLGNGDMLLCANIMPGAIRVQGAFVTDGDVEAVANEYKAMFGPAEFDSELMEVLEDKEENMGESNTFSETDFRRKMIIEASKLAFSKNGLRVSELQRCLSLGYNRAVEIIEELEKMGLLSEFDREIQNRRVIMTEEEWQEKLSSEDMGND